MALVKCSECSKDVSSAASSCPHCGLPLRISTAPQTQQILKTPALAIWSLVLGILSVTFAPVVAAIPAIICGNRAHSRIAAASGALSGKGMANAGLVMGYLSILLTLTGFILGIALPHFVHARQLAIDDEQRNACIANLKEIDGAVQQWALENQKKENDPVRTEDVASYLKGGRMPSCPSGGTYTLTSPAYFTRCSKHGDLAPQAH